jgi:maltooligosyltrehalose trehalohydrolase
VAFLQNHDQTGNRPFGERLTRLADPDALKAAIALLLLMPQIPMIFMGEEIGSRAPFFYFTDHGPKLAKAVREGRWREFASYAGVAPDHPVPDPNAPETFGASDPSRDAPDAEHWRDFYRRLLRLRQRRIIPVLDGARSEGAGMIGEAAVFARWRLGDGSRLAIASNLGREPVPLPDRGQTLIWGEQASEAVAAHTSLAWLDHA